MEDPEIQRGLRIVKDDWVQHIFYELDPFQAPIKFLTHFMKAANFIFSLDTEQTLDYAHRLRCVMNDRPLNYMRQPRGYYIIWDLLEFFKASKPIYMNHGVWFLRCERIYPV